MDFLPNQINFLSWWKNIFHSGLFLWTRICFLNPKNTSTVPYLATPQKPPGILACLFNYWTAGGKGLRENEFAHFLELVRALATNWSRISGTFLSLVFSGFTVRVYVIKKNVCNVPAMFFSSVSEFLFVRKISRSHVPPTRRAWHIVMEILDYHISLGFWFYDIFANS